MNQQYAHIMAQAQLLAQPEPRSSYCVWCGGWVRWRLLTAEADTLALRAILCCGHSEPVTKLKVVEE